MDSLKTYQIDKERIIFEQFDDETVLVNIESGYYYSLSASGTEIIGLLEDGCPECDLSLALFGNSEEMRPRQDLIETFIEELLSQNILVVREAHHPSHGPQEPCTPLYDKDAPYAQPKLERFDDVRDLLLIDPIHQVDLGYGWPKMKEKG